MTTHTQTALYNLLSQLAVQCEHDAELIVKNQEAGITALHLDLDYMTDMLAQVDEIADAFMQEKRNRKAH